MYQGSGGKQPVIKPQALAPARTGPRCEPSVADFATRVRLFLERATGGVRGDEADG